MDILSTVQGVAADYQVNLLDKDGQAVAFTLSDTLTAQIWAGDNQEVAATPTATWIDATQGQAKITISSVVSASLDASRYTMRLLVSVDGTTLEGWRGWLDVKPAPGSATELPAYCTYEDLKTYRPKIVNEMTDESQSGFAEARNLARKFIDQLLQSRFGSANVYVLGGLETTNGYSTWLQDQLDDDKLMLMPNVVEIATKKALALIYDSAICPGDKDGSYQQIAMRYEREARNLAKCLVAYLDLNGDGQPDVQIDCSKVSTR